MTKRLDYDQVLICGDSSLLNLIKRKIIILNSIEKFSWKYGEKLFFLTDHSQLGIRPQLKEIM